MRFSFRSIILLIIILAISIGVVVFLNREALAKATAIRRQITPDNFSGTKDINLGEIVEIKGTPDLLNAVSLEKKDSGEAVWYYAPLKEYANNFVVQIKKSKLKSEQQTFVGTVISLTKTDYDTRIRNVLNKPVELNDNDRGDLDADTIQLLTDQTTKDFNSKTLLVQDGETIDMNSLYGYIAFWSALLFIGFTTFARRYIFR